MRVVYLILAAIFLTHSLSLAETVIFDKPKWSVLAFNKIPQNQVTFTEGQLEVKVDKSAGPLVYKLDAPLLVSDFVLKGELSGAKIPEKSSFDEDSVLRFGLVVTGDKKLTAAKRLFAADWIIKLFSLAPKGTGLDKIYFFNSTDREGLVGKNRPHPKSELISEEVIKVIDRQGQFEISHNLAKPLEAAAIWLSIDGDDTKSAFTIKLKEINLNQSQNKQKTNASI